MKLYHFTYPENLFRIHLRGLEPGIHQQRTDPGMDWQTMGQPVEKDKGPPNSFGQVLGGAA